MKWKEVSHTVNLLGFMANDKKSTWVTSCKERTRREEDIMVMPDELVGVEKLDEQTKAMLNKGLRHLRRVRDEEKTANGRRNVARARRILPRETQKRTWSTTSLKVRR